ncbi:MAG: DUF3078 domain-containing protein [Flavobacteriales bacterium]
MKRNLTFVFALALLGITYAQEDAQDRKLNDGAMSDTKKEGWTKKGTNSLLFNQASFSNWVAGGVSSAGVLANIDYEFNYRKGKHMWDNRIILGYGLQANEGEDTKKTEDVINLTSKYRRQINKSKWFMGAALNFKTQFTKGYEYSDLDGNGAEEKYMTSNFMSPGYLQIGAGVDYIPNDKFELNIHPITSKMTFVSDKEVFKEYSAPGVYSYKDKAFGVKYGNSFFYELGIFVGARQNITLMKNITLDHQIGLYSNYFNHPERVDISYSAILNMKINKFISAQLTGDLLYDHDQLRDLQVKQTLGIGLTYNFGK